MGNKNRKGRFILTSFRISKGIEKDLPTAKTDGRMYFCTDTGNIYIDYKDGNNILRKLVNKQILDAKQDAITGAASTITSSNLTANRVLLSNSLGKVVASAVTSTELGYLDGVTSAVQTQLDDKAASSHNQAASTITAGTFAGQVVANSSGQTYSTYCLRNTRLASSDTNPTVNGQICWTYE